MASFLRNTFDNLVTNINSTFNINSDRSTRSNRRTNSRVPPGGYTGSSNNRPSAYSSSRNIRILRRNLPPFSATPREQETRSVSQPPTGRQHQTEGSWTHPQHQTMNHNLSHDNAVQEKLDIVDIRDPQDINSLSAKQLKIILTRNCVDYRGVFEKEVLREKVMQLWIDCNEKKSNLDSYNTHDGSQDYSEDMACKICMEREINCVLLECGHMLTCVTCGRKLAECPICRQNVSRCVRTFKG